MISLSNTCQNNSTSTEPQTGPEKTRIKYHLLATSFIEITIIVTRNENLANFVFMKSSSNILGDLGDGWWGDRN